MADGGSDVRRSSVVLLLALAIASLALGCGSSQGQSTAGSPSPFNGVDSLAKAEAAAREVVDATVSQFMPGLPTRQEGLGEHPCDPLENGEALYDYVVVVDVPAEEVEAVGRDVWDHWQSEYGFVPQSQRSANELPVIRAAVEGFRGSITVDPDQELVHVGISSPCYAGSVGVGMSIGGPVSWWFAVRWSQGLLIAPR